MHPGARWLALPALQNAPTPHTSWMAPSSHPTRSTSRSLADASVADGTADTMSEGRVLLPSPSIFCAEDRGFAHGRPPHHVGCPYARRIHPILDVAWSGTSAL